MNKSDCPKTRSSGNALFAVFGAIILVGLVGASVSSFVKGPLTSAVKQTRMNGAKAQMQIAAQVAVMASANGNTGAAAPYARVFVTSTAQNGNLGGLSGADSICQARATAASLPGTYKAWMSDSGNSPSTRFTQLNAPYKMVDGTLIANNWADLTDGTLISGINKTETGAAGGGATWSGTNADGTRETYYHNTCVDWTSASSSDNGLIGIPGATNSAWSSQACCVACNNAGINFYCVQQSATGPSGAGDCDNDGIVEPLEMRAAGANPAPTGGGLMPSTIGVSAKDPWGTPYGYCSWDYGSVSLNSSCQQATPGTNLRLAGSTTDQTTPVVAIISAGPDRIFTTTCRSYATADVNSNGSLNDTGDLALVGKASPQDDDVIFTYNYGQAVAASGGLWSLKSSNAAAATIPKNIEGQAAKFSGAGIFQKIGAITGDFVEAVSGLRLASPALLPTCDSTGIYVMRRNASSNAMEMCNGTSWVSMVSGSFASDPVPQTYNRVFVTSIAYTGNLGGLSGADNLCQTRANAANLPGKYMAWLGDSSGSPATRFYQSPLPYQLVDGTVIASNWADLIDGTLAAGIAKTELNTTSSAAQWTNVLVNGTLRNSTDTCVNWTDAGATKNGGFGLAGSTTANWTQVGPTTCNTSRTLYCFQQTEGLTNPTSSGTGAGAADPLADVITDYANTEFFGGSGSGSASDTGTATVSWGAGNFTVANMSGQYNTAFGAGASPAITSGTYNAAFGKGAGPLTTSGSYNTFAGFSAAQSLSAAGSSNTAIGSLAHRNGTTSFITAIGYMAGSSGGSNTALGAFAQNAVSGSQNTATGNYAQNSLSNGASNTSAGAYSSASITSASNVTSIGFYSMNQNTANQNTAVGMNTLSVNITGIQNTVVGFAAGYAATGSNLTAIGSSSLNSPGAGANNTVAGFLGLYANQSGADNTAVGYSALSLNTTGSYNTALGYSALSQSLTSNGNTAIGANSLYSLKSGDGNTTIGYSTLKSLVSGMGNVAIGYNAGTGVTNTSGHVLIGSSAQLVNPGGDGSVAIGFQALSNNTGVANVGIGYNTMSLAGATGSYNTAIGFNTINQGTTGGYNVAVGSNALSICYGCFGNTTIGALSGQNLTGQNNTLVGYQAGVSLVASNGNTAAGFRALASSVSGIDNTAIGSNAAETNTIGSELTAIGYNALRANISGSYSTAIGWKALEKNTLGHYNTASGYAALQNNTVGVANTAIGSEALTAQNGTGITAADCTAVGFDSSKNFNVFNDPATGHCYYFVGASGQADYTTAKTGCAATGAHLVSIETKAESDFLATNYSNIYAYIALDDLNTEGSFIVGAGDFTGMQIWSGTSTGSRTSGYTNWASGEPNALYSNSDCAVIYTAGQWVNADCDSAKNYLCEKEPAAQEASYNTALGKQALYSNTTGSNNTAIGTEAMKNNTTGSNNTAFGYQALITNTTGSNNTAFGANSGPATGALSNTIAIGYNASVSASNAVRVGDANITVIEGQVAFTSPSDKRLKKDITPSDLGLDFIMGLKPVSYRLKQGNGRLDYGFLAQDIEASLDGRVTNMITRRDDAMRTYQLRSADLIAPLVKAMQEQEVIIEKLQAKIDAIKVARKIKYCHAANPEGVSE